MLILYIFSAIAGDGTPITGEAEEEPMEQQQSELPLTEKTEDEHELKTTAISDASGAQSPTATTEQQPMNNEGEIPTATTPAVSGPRCTPRRPLGLSTGDFVSAAPSTPSAVVSAP